MFKVYDKIKDAFSAFLGALFAGGSGWMAFIMFQRGSWLIGAIGVIGALFFSSPLWAGLFITKKEPEPEPVVTKVDWPTDKAALLKLAQTVAGDDAEVMQLVKDSLASPEAFYAARSESEGELLSTPSASIALPSLLIERSLITTLSGANIASAEAICHSYRPMRAVERSRRI